MQIKRELDMTFTQSRRFIIRRSPAVSMQTTCTKCGEPMVEAKQAAKLFGVNQRRIFQIIETGAVHFAETESGGAIVCVTSLAAVLDVELEKQL